MKKCSPSLAIKEIQSETTVSFHLTPVRIATIKTTTNKCWRECGKKSPHTLTAGGNVSWYNHYGKQYGGFLKTKHKSAI
jgi:hypothetical protein